MPTVANTAAGRWLDQNKEKKGLWIAHRVRLCGVLDWELLAVLRLLIVRSANTVLLPCVPRHLIAQHALNIELPHEFGAFLYGELGDQHGLLVRRFQFLWRLERGGDDAWV